jgi:hypothetical protein
MEGFGFARSATPIWGRLDEARAIVARLRAITSVVVQSDLPFRNPEDRELLRSGLRLAAGEQTRRLAAILAPMWRGIRG